MHSQVCEPRQKHERFLVLFRAVYQGERAIVFCDTKRGCEALRAELSRAGTRAESLHGDKSQQERDWVMQQFRTGEAKVLLATDVASRGLDVKDVRVVINYDAPSQVPPLRNPVPLALRSGGACARVEGWWCGWWCWGQGRAPRPARHPGVASCAQAEDYVHRIGRAGRAGASGSAYTLITPADAAVAKELVVMLRKTRSGVPQELERVASLAHGSDSNRRWR